MTHASRYAELVEDKIVPGEQWLFACCFLSTGAALFPAIIQLAPAGLTCMQRSHQCRAHTSAKNGVLQETQAAQRQASARSRERKKFGCS